MKNDKLHKLTTTGFKTPDAYFETFEEQLFERLKDKEPLAGINTTGYKVPKDYFDSVDDIIFTKIKPAEKSVIQLSPRKKVYYLVGIAASLLLLVALFLNNEKTETVITAEMAQIYFEEQGVSSYDLVQLISETTLSEEDLSIIDTPYDEENLETYLLENSDIESMLD